MSLTKKVYLTITGYDIKLSDNLTFYQKDQLKLIFYINEYGIDYENNATARALMPVNPLNAILFIENPDGVDSVSSAKIEDNAVTFYLDSTHTQYVGVSRIQLRLFDQDGCAITLPHFTFEIRENIYGSGDVRFQDVVMVDQTGTVILTEDNDMLDVGDVLTMGTEVAYPQVAKTIKELPIKHGLDGTEKLIVEDNEATKQAPLGTIVDEIKQNSQEKIREIESELAQTNAQLETIVDEIKQNSQDSQEKIREIESELAQTNAQLSQKANADINGNYVNIVDYEKYCQRIELGGATFKCWDRAVKVAVNEIGNGRILFPSDLYYFNEELVIPKDIILYGDNWDGSILVATPSLQNKNFITISNAHSGLHHVTISGENVDGVMGLNITHSQNLEIHHLAFINFIKNGYALNMDAMNLQLNNFKFWACKKIVFAGSDNGFSNIMATSCLTLELRGGNNRYQNISFKGGDVVSEWSYQNTYGILMTGTRNQYNIIECQDAICHGILMKNLSSSQCFNVLADSNGSGKRKGIALTNIIGIHITSYSYDTILHSISDNYIEDNRTQDFGLVVDSVPARLTLNHLTLRHNNKDIIESTQYLLTGRDIIYNNTTPSGEFLEQTISVPVKRDTIDIVYGSFNDELIFTKRFYWKIGGKCIIDYNRPHITIYRELVINENGIAVSKPYSIDSEGNKTYAGDDNYIKIFKIIGYQNNVY